MVARRPAPPRAFRLLVLLLPLIGLLACAAAPSTSRSDVPSLSSGQVAEGPTPLVTEAEAPSPPAGAEGPTGGQESPAPAGGPTDGKESPAPTEGTTGGQESPVPAEGSTGDEESPVPSEGPAGGKVSRGSGSPEPVDVVTAGGGFAAPATGSGGLDLASVNDTPERAPRPCPAFVPMPAAEGDDLPFLPPPADPQPVVLAELERQLQAYVATLPGTYGVQVIDLTTGATASVNADSVFVAASTFKVPLAMYVLDLVERGEADLAEPIHYKPEDWEGGTGLLQAAIEGDCFTVAELLDLSLTVSDNIATNMLLRHFGSQHVVAYMHALGGTVTNLDSGRRATTPGDTARYMERAYREAASAEGSLYRTLMATLTRTAFSDRIAEGVPEGIPVAHKIGTLPAMVHDVGVVFLPDRPFVISIFSADVDEQAAAAALAEITRIVYRYQAGAAPTPPFTSLSTGVEQGSWGWVPDGFPR